MPELPPPARTTPVRSTRLLLAAALLSTLTLSAARESKPAAFINRLEAGEKLTIVTMGTSLTGGQWRWPDVMMTGWLNRDYTGQVTLFNEGVGASASSVGPGNNAALSGLGKLPAVIARKPDVVFIEFAVNDAYLPYHITVEDSKRNLNTIIDRILDANPRTEIILQTMNPVKDQPALGADGAASQRPRLTEYVEGCRQVGKARGLRLVDHYPNWQKLMLDDPAEFDRLVPDGIHPHDEGYWQILLPELRRTLTPPPPEQPIPYLQHPTDHDMTVCLLAPTADTTDVIVSLTKDGAPQPTEFPAVATAIPNTPWTVWKRRLTGLQPGARHQYQVRYRAGEQPAHTRVHHFHTLAPAAPSLRAIAFNDTHMGTAVMESLLRHVQPEDFELSLLLGDVLEGSDRAVLEAWRRYVELLDGANKPIIYVRGNHDTRGAFAKRLAYLFDLPNLDPARPWGDEQWQFTLRAGPVALLALDTGEDDDDSTPAASYKNPNLWQQVRQRQASWLPQAIADQTMKSPPWRVLLTHIPLYNSPWCSARSRTLWTPVLRDWQPDLALSGHDHQWRPAQPVPQGVPWPSLTGGGPAMSGAEEGTMMILAADSTTLKVRLIGAKDGRAVTEFHAKHP
jgi:lysophospholipase L1-like esterase